MQRFRIVKENSTLTLEYLHTFRFLIVTPVDFCLLSLPRVRFGPVTHTFTDVLYCQYVVSPDSSRLWQQTNRFSFGPYTVNRNTEDGSRMRDLFTNTNIQTRSRARRSKIHNATAYLHFGSSFPCLLRPRNRVSRIPEALVGHRR